MFEIQSFKGRIKTLRLDDSNNLWINEAKIKLSANQRIGLYHGIFNVFDSVYDEAGAGEFRLGSRISTHSRDLIIGGTVGNLDKGIFVKKDGAIGYFKLTDIRDFWYKFEKEGLQTP